MSSSSQKSPYKKMKSRNMDYVRYKTVGQLEPHKAYKIYDIVHASHPKFGEGEMAYVMEPKKIKWRVQLPGKYLRNLDLPHDIEVFKTDIKAGRFPYLIFRETMDDKSYRIDIVEDSKEISGKFMNSENIDELEFSEESENDVGNVDSLCDPQQIDTNNKSLPVDYEQKDTKNTSCPGSSNNGSPQAKKMKSS